MSARPTPIRSRSHPAPARGEPGLPPAARRRAAGSAASAVGGFTLGPFSATVDGIGAALEVITGGDGLAGLGAELSFVPPHRVVFALESEVVNGGGFVDIDLLLGRYAGGLAL